MLEVSLIDHCFPLPLTSVFLLHLSLLHILDTLYIPPFSASMHRCRRNHTHPKSCRLLRLTSFPPSTSPMALTLASVLPLSSCWLLWSSVRSPIPFLRLSYVHTHAQSPINIQSGTQHRFLICIYLSFIPFFHL
ncbi:hypothetical protein BDM02DRAFT_2089170 [Thelephora ganbajun]|uniref:Uncharacterized protein n=1 Tax=Thelephora ganbajun TaxID=370292 RepID=A0ACB6ZGL8_THEGA|nr:hypothetical protein BDM02DRAFT_2089170 [Thelephora ganbajun]